MDTRLADRIEDGVQPVIERAGVNPRKFLQGLVSPQNAGLGPTYWRAFLQHLPDSEAEIIVDTSANQCNDIDGLEHVVYDPCKKHLLALPLDSVPDDIVPSEFRIGTLDILRSTRI